MSIRNASVGTSIGQVYASTNQTAITTLVFCNTSAYNASSPTANTSNLTVYAVPSGQAAGTSNMVVNALPIPAGETFTFDTEKMVLDNNDAIYAVATVANITATISYMSV